MATMNTADIGFEKEIWRAADKMRGNIDASEYKSVVLGLIFLKYISDKFETKYRQLVDEGEGFEEDKDEYTAENIFYVPAEARWDAIASQVHTPEIGTAIDNAMRAIERENRRLKDILPKNFARPELDKRRLGEVVDLFTNIRMHEHGESKDILGRTYEYCLSRFAEAEGKLAGEFYTPACVVKTLVQVLQPFRGRVYDPCCGSGGMFVQSARFIESHAGNINNISVYGQDSNPTTWKMAQMNLAIRGIEADLGQYNADTFFHDCHPTLKADFVMANPPFNLSDWGADRLADDVRWRFGTPPNGNANFAWIQHIIHHLAPLGTCGRRAGQRLAVEPERRRGRHPAATHRGRPRGLHRGHAPAVVLYDADSRLDLVLQQGQDAAGLHALYRRAQPRDDGHTQAARADRLRVGGSVKAWRHPAHRRYLPGIRRGASGGGAGLLRRGDDRGDCGTGLYSDAGTLCWYRGAGGGFGTLRGEDGAADGRAFGVFRTVARSGGGDPPAVGEYRV